MCLTFAENTIQHDILIYLKDAFDEILNRFNRDFVPEIPLDEDWPSNKRLQALADVAVPLFIVAATVWYIVLIVIIACSGEKASEESIGAEEG